MKTLILANPNAGRLESREQLEAEAAKLLGHELRFTEAPGEAERLARESLRDGCRLVVAAGGDGTINEVVNGLSEDFGSARLAILPLGTGNDLARSIGVPADLVEALEVLRQGRVRRLDVVRARFGADGGAERYFLNMATGGFSGDLNEAMDKERKTAWGPFSYLRSAVEAAAEIRSFEVSIEAEGQEPFTSSAVSAVVANGRYAGGGVPAAPEACVDDGLLDVVIIPALSMGQLAWLMPRMLAGTHLSSEHVRFFRTRRLRIESDPPCPFNLDGEEAGVTPVELEILPGALEVVVGPEMEG